MRLTKTNYAADLFARGLGDGAEEGEECHDAWVEADKEITL